MEETNKKYPITSDTKYYFEPKHKNRFICELQIGDFKFDYWTVSTFEDIVSNKKIIVKYRVFDTKIWRKKWVTFY